VNAAKRHSTGETSTNWRIHEIKWTYLGESAVEHSLCGIQNRAHPSASQPPAVNRSLSNVTKRIDPCIGVREGILLGGRNNFALKVTFLI